MISVDDDDHHKYYYLYYSVVLSLRVAVIIYGGSDKDKVKK